MRDMEERKAPVSRSYPHTKPRGELTVHIDVPCTHKHTQTNTRVADEASFFLFFFFFSPIIPHAQSIFSKQQVRRVCLPLQHNTERDERERGEEEEKRGALFKGARREEFMWMWEKHTTLLPWLFFFLLQRGSRGPYNHCLIITSMDGRCVSGGMHRRRDRKQERKIK